MAVAGGIIYILVVAVQSCRGNILELHQVLGKVNVCWEGML